jgi:hypothetical protein
VAVFTARLAGIPDLKVEIEATVVSGNIAAASFVYSGTHNGPARGSCARRSCASIHFLRYFQGSRRPDCRALGHGRSRRGSGTVEGLTGELFKPSPLYGKSQISSSDSRLKRVVSTEGILMQHTASVTTSGAAPATAPQQVADGSSILGGLPWDACRDHGQRRYDPAARSRLYLAR